MFLVVYCGRNELVWLEKMAWLSIMAWLDQTAWLDLMAEPNSLA